MLIDEYKEKYEDNETKECTFCERQVATAIWMTGDINIYCCKLCAVEILPQFMADAVVGGTPENEIKNIIGPTKKITSEEGILKRFYSSFTSALIRKFKN